MKNTEFEFNISGEGKPADIRLSALRKIERVDADSGVENSGSIDSYLSALGIFCDSAPHICTDLDSFIDNNDLEDYTIKVHALKSTLRIIGAIESGENAQKLENAGKSRDAAYIFENHATFTSDVRKLAAELSEVMKGFSASQGSDILESEERPVIDSFVLSEAYTELYNAAQDMDIDALEDVFTELEDYSIPDSERDLYDELKEACDSFEYERIAELISKNRPDRIETYRKDGDYK